MKPFEYPQRYQDSRPLFARLVAAKDPHKQAAIAQYQREKAAMAELMALQQSNRARAAFARRLNIAFTCLTIVGAFLLFGSFS